MTQASAGVGVMIITSLASFGESAPAGRSAKAETGGAGGKFQCEDEPQGSHVAGESRIAGLCNLLSRTLDRPAAGTW